MGFKLLLNRCPISPDVLLCCSSSICGVLSEDTDACAQKVNAHDAAEAFCHFARFAGQQGPRPNRL